MKYQINRSVKIGAVLFVLWGLLHIVAGGFSAVLSIASGPEAVFTGFGMSVPTGAEEFVKAAGAIALDFGIILAGYGVLGVWAGVLVWRGSRLGFWLATVMLFIADGAFVYALILPGHASLADGILGPILYAAGAAFAGWGMYGPPATAGRPGSGLGKDM